MEPRKLFISLPRSYWFELETFVDSNGILINEAIRDILLSAIDEWNSLDQMVTEMEDATT